MMVQALLHGITLIFFVFSYATEDLNEETKPVFVFSWAEDKDKYIAGDTATIKIKILGNFDPHSYNVSFNPNVTVNGKVGNSSYISGLSLNFKGDLSSWSMSFVPISSGVFNVLITDDHFGVLDSSLHFFVDPGPMHPCVSIASWMDYVNEFVAGTRAMVLVQPKDAFGNGIPSTNAELNSYLFNVTASYKNNTPVIVVAAVFLGWNNQGYLRIEFIASTAGDLLLHVQKDNQTLRGSPLPFKVHPGPIEVSMCVAEWNYGSNVTQLFSKIIIFIFQMDIYGNLVPGSYPFDAEIMEKGTNLSMPVPDLNFKEVSPGTQVLSFSALEPGNFLLWINDAEHNTSISNMPYDFKISIGYCDGFNSIVNGSGLNHSIAGQEARFSVYLKDKYQYPAPVDTSMLQVQIRRKSDYYSILPTIHPLESLNGSRSPWRLDYDAMLNSEVASVPSSAGSLDTISHAYDVAYTPERYGVYEIHVLCGNIPLNGGYSFEKEVKAGEVNMSLSGVVSYVPKTQKLTKNEIIVQLMDSFSNPVLSQQSKLKLEIGSLNHSGFVTGMFVDKNDGSYTGEYQVNDIGTYELCASFDGNHFLPCPLGVNVYSSEYFPRASDDIITVWEDESILFNALGNDYFAGENATVIGFSNLLSGSVLQNGPLFRYTPFKGFYGNDSFSYTILDLNGNSATANVYVAVLSIPPQFVSFPTNWKASEDVMSPKFGGFHGIEMTYPDSTENITVTISANSGTVSLAPMLMQYWLPIWTQFSVSHDGHEAKALTLSGHVEVINMVLQSIQYLGDENFYGEDVIKISARNKNGITDFNVTIFVEPVNDPPFFLTPEYIILEEDSTKNGSMIYQKGRNQFDFLIGDPDLLHFPGKKSDFLVILSMEVTSGVLEATLPVELINTTELKQRDSYQWQPLQTFVTISKHFVIRARALRFHATVDECNSIVQHLVYHATEYGAVLTITINDMGNYGCFPDCAINGSKSLISEVNVNLIKRRPLSSREAYGLGFLIVLEFLAVVSLGGMLLFYICRCAIALMNDKKSHNTINDERSGIQITTGQMQLQAQQDVAGKATTATS